MWLARLRLALTQFLLRIEVLPWDEAVAHQYGTLCATSEGLGISFSDMDMMIGAHALHCQTVLVSRDKAFAQIADHLQRQVWRAQRQGAKQSQRRDRTVDSA